MNKRIVLLAVLVLAVGAVAVAPAPTAAQDDPDDEFQHTGETADVNYLWQEIEGSTHNGSHTFVLDSESNAVVVIDNGQIQDVHGLSSLIPDPVGIADDGSNLYVLDASGQLFELTWDASITGTNSLQTRDYDGLAYDAGMDRFLAHESGFVFEYDRSGTEQANYVVITQEAEFPTDLWVDGDSLWGAFPDASQIRELNLSAARSNPRGYSHTGTSIDTRLEDERPETIHWHNGTAWTFGSETEIGYGYRWRTPDISSPSPSQGGTSADRSPTISVDVQYPNIDDESVQLTFHDTSDGTVIGTATANSNGRHGVTWSSVQPGENTWNVTAEDQYGRTVSTANYSFRAPGHMEIRDVKNNSAIDDREVDVEFISEDTDDVVRRSTSDGEIDLEGLGDETYLAELDADGYATRSFVLRTIYENQTAYLLPEANTSVVEHRFSLEDYTGQFQSSQSQLVLHRVVELSNGDTRFVPVAGDTFGAANQIDVLLEQDVRYRLRIHNDEGLTQQLGGWRASTGMTPLEIGQITWNGEGETWEWRTSLENTTQTGAANETGTIEFEFHDPEEQTQSLELTIHEQHNENNVLHQQTYSVDDGTVFESVDLQGDEMEATWRVEFEAERGNQTISASRVISDELSLTENPFSGEWAIAAVAIVLLFFGFLFGGVYGGVGALFVGAMSAFMVWLGWLPLPITIPLGALVLAVLWLMGGNRPSGGVAP